MEQLKIEFELTRCCFTLHKYTPIDLTINIIKEKWNDLKDYNTLNKKEYIKATELCLNSTYFQYKDELYAQIFGTKMGSPLSPVVANLVLEHLEEVALNNLTFHPIFF